MSDYKLLYFNGKGKGEGIRYIFAAAGQKYEDFRFSSEQWPSLKANTPFGQVPVLEVTEEGGERVTIAQSTAIARYLANKFGLAGKSDLEKARADQVVDQINDLFNQWSQALYYEPDEARKKEKLDKFFAETFPNNVVLFEKLLGNQKTKFFASNEITWADLIFSANLERLADKRDQLLASAPAVKALDEAVRAHPNIANWIATRPVGEF